MRSIVLIAGVIVLVGGVMLFLKSNDEMTTPSTNTDIEEQTTIEETGSETDATTHSDMDTAVESDSEGGTDAGMEFPDMDMTIPEDAKVFDVSGTNFAYSVDEMRVQEGDTVVIQFTSDDGFHDWVVDEFDAKTARVQTGGTTSVTFVADKKGTFEYYCSVGQHRANGMVGNLIVE